MKLNIVILTKDEPEAFRLIARVCELSRPEDRVIVWDDFSCVTWLGMLRYWQQVFPFEYRQHEWDHSFCRHRNAVKPVIHPGEWVVMIDADEWVGKAFLRSIRNAIERHPKADSFLISRVNGFYPHAVVSKMPEPDWDNLKFWDKTGPFPSYPDWQPRVWRNDPDICYVHDVCNWFSGTKTTVELSGKDVSLFHFKSKYWFNRYKTIPLYGAIHF